MKDIVVIFVHTRDQSLPAEQPPEIPKMPRAKKSVSSSLPQFWTWFIENPRPRPSTSSTIAPLTLKPLFCYAVTPSVADTMVDVAAILGVSHVIPGAP